MRNFKSLIWLFSAVILPLGGCASKQQLETRNQLCVPNLEKANAMEIAEDVIARMHFTVDKADTEQGLITTKPLTSSQFFEFWRSDAASNRDLAEANIHSIQRSVRLDITSRAGQMCFDCTVSVRRLTMTEEDPDRPGLLAYTSFSRDTAAMQELKMDRKRMQLMGWIDLGPDEKLATRIINRIEKRIAGAQKEAGK